MNINDTFSYVTSTLKGFVALGMALMVTFMVVDVLFPGTTDIVSNVAGVINSFIGQGMVGLITLIFFVAIFSRQ